MFITLSCSGQTQHVVYEQHSGAYWPGSAVTWPWGHTPVLPLTSFVTMDGLLFISLNLSLVTCNIGHRNLSPKDVESLETSWHAVGAELNGSQI